MKSEELSISVIQEIIMDGDTFTNLLNRTGRFKNIDINYYLKMINNYMDYLVNNTQNLTMPFFERVNYLNRLFNVKISYNYNDYLKSEHMVTNKVIKVILINKNVLAKFMNFDNNKTCFKNIPIEQYLLKMYNLITYYEKNNIKIKEEMLENFEIIMSKYSLKLKRMHILPGQKVKEQLNKEFEEAILNGINLKESKFIVALNIYINLCKLVNFDFNYFAYYKKLDEKVIIEQMNRDISTITLENNNVVCSTFAKLYARVLNDVGIRATVSGDIHKYVFLDVDGTIITADATNLFNDDDNLHFNDIVRVQMGLGTAGFVCHEKHKNIKQDILNAYVYCHYKQITKEDLTENFTKEHDDKISLILNTCQNSSMNNLELMIYMKKILKYILQNSYNIFYVARRIDDINFTSQLLIYYHDVYFILSKNKIEHINLCKLKKMMENDELRKLNIKDSIPGLDDKILKK